MLLCTYICTCSHTVAFLPQPFFNTTFWKLSVALQFHFLLVFWLENPFHTSISTCFQSVMKCLFFEIHCHGFATVNHLVPHNHGLYHFIFIFTLILFHIQSLDQYLQLVRLSRPNCQKHMAQGAKTCNIFMEKTV